MFAGRYFPSRYFPDRYWPKVGEDGSDSIVHEFTLRFQVTKAVEMRIALPSSTNTLRFQNQYEYEARF